MYGNERAIARFERGQRGIPKRPVLDRELKDPALANIFTETGQRVGYPTVYSRSYAAESLHCLKRLTAWSNVHGTPCWKWP
jgi:hypothetical protein